MYQYDLSPRVVAFSTTRHGGVSTDNYASFNINHYCGDNPENIQRNQQLLCGRLGIGRDRLVYPHQTHQAIVYQITDDFLALEKHQQDELLDGVDALVTDVQGVCIGVSTADCIPIIIYDPDHHAVATVHAGWRGTVARIVQKTVDVMRTAFHSEPSALLAVIGPGISLKNFEVGNEVYNAFASAGFPMELIARQYPVVGENVLENNVNNTLSHCTYKWHLDLPLCNSLQLQECGLRKEKIQMSGICTFDRYDDYFSARRLGINSGRIFTGALLS